MRIQRRLFAAFLALLLAVLVPAAILLDRWLSADARQGVEDALDRRVRILAAELERAWPDDVPGWVDRISRVAEGRVTVIAPDGRVLGDSKVPASGLAMVENHAERPEVKAARDGHPGTATRRSTTVSERLLYIAAPVGQPARAVVRVALPLANVSRTVAEAQAAVWLAGLLALGLAVVLGAVIARWLSRPLAALTGAARAMSRGDFAARLPEAPDNEIGDLVHAFEALRGELQARLEELRAEGEKLRAILDGMSEGVALVQDGSITVSNRAFLALLGAGRGVEGGSFLEAARVPEAAETIDQAMDGHRPEPRELQLGGRTLLLRAYPLGGAPSRQAVVVLVDATEQRRLERLRRDFVANASHELRTPVAAIVGAAETLAGPAAEDREARASFIDILLRHAQRLSRLTADLLDLARLEAGYRPRVEAVPLEAAALTVVTTLRPRADERRITLSVSVPADVSLAAERAAVEQILTNLIDNAIKYTPPGGTVTVLARPDGPQVAVVVEDTGPGIPREHLPRLFERFYRVDAARSRELGGTGLGLAIVKHLVMAHGGDVQVASAPGQGARFTVTLPRA